MTWWWDELLWSKFKDAMVETYVTHRACGTPIFAVPGNMTSGREIRAAEWRPLGDWPAPVAGAEARCPACGNLIAFDDACLERTVVTIEAA